MGKEQDAAMSVCGEVKACVKKLDDYTSETEQQLPNLRSFVMEAQIGLLLKASRIALRSTDLSQEERRLALLSLDEKQKAISKYSTKIKTKPGREGVVTLER